MEYRDIINQLEELLNRAPCGIGLFDADTSRPVFLNDEYFNIVGCTREELTSVDVEDMKKLVLPSDRKAAEDGGVKYRKSGVAQDSEYRIVRKDGKIAWVKLNLSTVMLDDKEYAFASFTDITSEKESSAQISIIAENVTSSVSLLEITDGRKKLIYANDRFFTMIGVSREQYEQNSLEIDRLVIAANDRNRIRETVEKAIRTGNPCEVEHQLLRENGKPLWVSRRCAAIRQNKPDSYLIISVVDDITEKKNAELIEAMENHRYQLVIDELNAAVFEWNLKTGEFYRSEAYQNYAMSLVSDEDILSNRGPLDTVHPDDLPILKDFFKETKKGLPRVETTLRAKMTDGSYRWCRMIGFYFKDKEGNPTRTIGVILDINEERERELVLNSLINEIPGGVAVFKASDQQLECQYFNDGFARLSGRTRKELDELIRKNQLIQSVIAPSDIPTFQDSLKMGISKNQNINLMYRYLYKDGTINWLHMSATKMREEDGFPVYYCVFTMPCAESQLYRSVVEGSANGVLIAERYTHRVIYMNKALHQIYNIAEGTVSAESRFSDIVADKRLLIPQEQIDALQYDRYTEFHITCENRLYLSIRGKALVWNGVDAYILHVTDESQEHEHQMQLQKLVDHIPGGIGIFDLYEGKAHLVYLNDSFYELLSDKRENRIYEKDTKFFANTHPDDRAVLQKAIASLEAGVDRVSFNYRTKRSDDSYIWLRLTAEVYERKNGTVTINCSFTDFQETKLAEEKLEAANAAIKQQYEAELERRKMLEKSAMVSVVSNVTKGHVLEIRRADGGFFEIPEKMPCKSATELVVRKIPDEKDKQQMLDFMNDANLVECYKRGKTENIIEYKSLQADGELHWMRAISNLVRDTVTGDVLSYGYFYDINRKKTDQLAAESAIDEEIDYVLNVKAKTGIAHFVQLKPSFGMTAEFENDFSISSISKNDRICDAEDYPAVVQFFNVDYLKKELEKSVSVSINIRANLPEGRTLHKKAKAYYLDERKSDIVIVCLDITALYEEEQHQKQALQKAADEAIRANRAKSDFLSRMSHDMRTPLNGMLGLANLIKNQIQDSAVLEDLSQMQVAGQYLLNLINDTLDVSRIESGKLELHPSVCDGKSFFGTVMKLGKATTDAKHINVDVITDGLQYPMLYIDIGRVEQVMMNIIGNAVKFTSEGGHITCTMKNISIKDGVITDEVCIRDSGIGMSKEFLEHIFEPFSQADSSRKNANQGTGLGMSITKQLVELMGGTISVKSEPGVGTSVIFTLVMPIATEKQIAEWNKTKQPDKEYGSLKDMRVLLVEDHPLNAKIATRMMIQKGIQVDHAENGKEGLEMFQSSRVGYYQIILMDIRMPVMDGIEATEAIRKLSRADAEYVPIVAMTANAFDEDIRATKEAGMNAHLSKPVDPQKLYETLEQYVK